MVSRRGFLKGMLGLAVAPAICKAENLMKIWVPPQELVIGRGMTRSIVHVDEMGFLGGDYDGDTISIYNLGKTIDLPPEWQRSYDQEARIRKAIERQADLAESLRANTIAVTRYPIVGDQHMMIMKF